MRHNTFALFTFIWPTYKIHPGPLAYKDRSIDLTLLNVSNSASDSERFNDLLWLDTIQNINTFSCLLTVILDYQSCT